MGGTANVPPFLFIRFFAQSELGWQEWALGTRNRRLVGNSGGEWGNVGVLTGEYRHNLDEKGRLFVPARLREELGETFILTRGLDNCLFGFSLPTWNELQKRLDQLPMNKAASRAFTRLLFSGASECTADRQGRILIPTVLRQFAGLTRETVVLGVSQRLEIWDAQRWDEYTQTAGASFAQLAEEMVDFNLG